MYIYEGVKMLELGISQAQAQFTQLLTKSVLIVDKKAHQKKAVILPYEEYNRLLTKANRSDVDSTTFLKFVGILNRDFKTDDAKYNDILT